MSDSTETCCPPARELGELEAEPGEIDERLASYAKALGHPARVSIMRILFERNACVCGEIVELLPLAQSTVSQHLKVLKEAGLVRGDVDGPSVCYCVEPHALEHFSALLSGLSEQR